MNHWNENEQVISNNIKDTDSPKVKNLKENIFYARLAAAKANTKEKVEKINKDLDALLAKLEELQPIKPKWSLVKSIGEAVPQQKGGKRKQSSHAGKTRKSKKSRKGRKHTRKH